VLDENNVRLAEDACSRTVNETFTAPTWRLALNYTPAESQLIYASASTGYLSGGFNSRGRDNFTLQPFDQENVFTVELGYKGDWRFDNDVQLRTNFAAYHQDYDDIQKSQGFAVDGQFGSTVINAAKATVQGAELEFTLVPNDWLQLSLAYSWVDTGYDEWDLEELIGTDANGAPITEILDNSDQPFTWIPEQSVNGEIKLFLPLDDDYGQVYFTASYYWQDEMFSNEEWERLPENGWSAEDLAEVQATVIVPSYSVWNVRADWNSVLGSNFDLALFCNNVTDKDYITGGRNIPESLGWADFTFGPPRVIGLSARYNF